jgi:hypothetical protein
MYMNLTTICAVPITHSLRQRRKVAADECKDTNHPCNV